MEEFDRYIKSEIESLNAVPGVSFNEKHVWRNVVSSWNGNYMFSLIIILVTLVLVYLLFLPKEESVEGVVFDLSDESKSVIAIDKPNHLSEHATHQENSGTIKNNIDTESNLDLSDTIENEIHEVPEDMLEEQTNPSRSSDTNHSSLAQKQTIKSFNYLESTDIQKEYFFSIGKETQTFGYTYLKPIDSHFSFTYGFQIDRSWRSIPDISKDFYNRLEFHQIQIPIGLRYDFLKKEGGINPFLYSGLQNSFAFSHGSKMLDYSMMLESQLGADFRIFSAKDGKKGYLRFKIPLYNKSIINHGVYKPTLYDALK